jgi:hypothetical protein
MYLLGLTILGDAAALLICDDRIVAAAEEERFSRLDGGLMGAAGRELLCSITPLQITPTS